MRTMIILWLFVASAIVSVMPRDANATADVPEAIAKQFAGVYRFHYIFMESGTPYVDIPGHLQLLELDRNNGSPQIKFFNKTRKGEKRSHYSYVFRFDEGKLILREFDGSGKFRFDCVGSFKPEDKVFECAAPRAPKPARDTDSPLTRRIGLFKRPISWPAYETLDRNNIFRFYDWGFVNIQENLKRDAEGEVVARETGVITAVKTEASREKP